MNSIKTARIWRAIIMLQLLWFWTSQTIIRFWTVRRIVSSYFFPSHSLLRKARVDFFQKKRIMLPFSALCSLGHYRPPPFPSKVLETYLISNNRNNILSKLHLQTENACLLVKWQLKYTSVMYLLYLASKTYKLQHLIRGRSPTDGYSEWARMNQSQAKFY